MNVSISLVVQIKITRSRPRSRDSHRRWQSSDFLHSGAVKAAMKSLIRVGITMISVISRISVGLRQASAAIGSYIIQTTIHHLFHQIIPPLCFRSSKRLHFEKRLIIKGCRTCPATGSIFSIAEILLEVLNNAPIRKLCSGMLSLPQEQEV